MSDDPKPMPEPVKIDLSKWATPVSVLLLGAVLLYQQVKGPIVPTPVPVPPAPVVVPVRVEPTDAIVERDGVRLDADKTKLFCDVVNAGDGTFLISYQPIGKKRVARTVVVSGDVVPPVPPKPDPPKPVPPEPPQPSGPLTILLLRESKDSTPEMASLVRDLRTGTAADYLKTKNHSLGILDVDTKDKDGNPSPAVQEWKAQFSGLTMPAILIYDTTTKAVIHKQSIPNSTTAAGLITTIKEHGG